MRPVSDAFHAAVTASHERVTRVFLLDADLQPAGELTGEAGVAVEGVVSIDSNRRRSCSLTLANPAGVWSPAGPDDPLFPNARIRIERGIVVDDEPELVSLGVFIIDRPSTFVDASGSRIQITGQDRVKLALKSRFTTPASFVSGTAIADVVRQVAQSAGMGDTLYRLDDVDKALHADRTFETDADRWSSIQQVASDYALVCYVDADGLLVLEPDVTPDTLPEPSWTFERGDQAIMLGVTKTFNDDRLYNHVRVSGEAANLAPVVAEARDLNPESPAYNPDDGTGPIGDRLYTYTSAMVRTLQQAAEVAAALLLKVALIEEDLSIPSIVHPALEAGDAIAVTEATSRTADTYLVDSLDIPLGAGAMQVRARKLRSLT